MSVERQEQSNIFLKWMGKPEIKIVYPPQPEEKNKIITSKEEVKRIMDTRDYTGLYFRERGTNDVGFSFTGAKDNTDFEIFTSMWKEESYSPQFYAKLAQEVEEKVGRKSLQIVIF